MSYDRYDTIGSIDTTDLEAMKKALEICLYRDDVRDSFDEYEFEALKSILSTVTHILEA